MDIHISDITKRVALALDVFPDFSAEGWVIGSGTSLRDMVEVVVESKAREVTKNIPREDCNFVKDMRDHLRQHTDWGTDNLYTCELPTDFLRLNELWLSDWPNPLTEDFQGDTLRLGLGQSAPEWLAERPARPMYRIIHHDDLSPSEILFGPTKTLFPQSASYIPRPFYDEDEGILHNFQPDALQPLVDSIAKAIGG